MKRILFKILSYIVVLMIIACTYVIYENHFTDAKTSSIPNKTNTVQITDLSNFKSKINISTDVTLPPIDSLNESYGLKIYNSNENFINSKILELNNNSNLELFVSAINATSNDDSVGILIALDGEFQKFEVDDNQDQDYIIYKTDLKSMSMINIPVKLAREDIEKHNRLDIVMIYHMDEIPGGKMRFIDFYTNSIRFYINSKSNNIDMIFNKLNQEKAIFNLPERFVGKVRSVGVRNLIDTKDLTSTTLSQKNFLQAHTNDYLKLYFYGAGGKGRYASTVFLDHKPIEIVEDQFTVYYELGDNELFMKEFILRVPEMKGKYQLYALTVPLDDLPFVTNSQKSVLEVD